MTGRFNLNFADKKASAESVGTAVSKAAKLRETHLSYDLTMMDVLTLAQVALYDQLRGY